MDWTGNKLEIGPTGVMWPFREEKGEKKVEYTIIEILVKHKKKDLENDVI